MSLTLVITLATIFVFNSWPPALDAKQIQCKSDAECPLLTNGHLNICIGRTHILRSGNFASGYCADSNSFGDCSTDVDCILLYRRKGLACSQAPGQPRGFKHCVQKSTNFGWVPCKTDDDCTKESSKIKTTRRHQSPLDVCVGKIDSQKEGFCWNSKTIGKCKTDFDCRHRGKGNACGRTPNGGYACYYSSCKSPILCPQADK